MIIQDSRIQMKYSTISGVVPTIPASDDHTDGTWLITDIYEGEVFFNIADNLGWWRSASGLVPFGATGSTGFIGDFVSKSAGGTYSGPVYGPKFQADEINGYAVNGVTGTFSGPVSASTYYGDGSHLTGIVATWNGGTVTNPTTFISTVEFNSGINVDNIAPNGPTLFLNGDVEISNNLEVGGNMTAGTYYGDGSQLTGITGTANDYTTAANLVGTVIHFDRTDLVDAYSVDLASIAGPSVTSATWDGTLNELTLNMSDSTQEIVNISSFTDLTLSGNVTADYFIGDGSLLTNLPVTTGPTGATGSTGSTGATGSAGPRAVMNLSYTGSSLTLGTGTITLPINPLSPIVNLGWQQGTRVRVWHSATEYMEGQITSVIANPQTTGINVNIDYVVGTGSFGAWYVGIAGDVAGGGSQNLQEVLIVGNNTIDQNIVMGSSTIIGSSGGSGRIDMDNGGSGDVIKIDATTANTYSRIILDGNGEVNLLGIDNTTSAQSSLFVNSNGIQKSTSNGLLNTYFNIAPAIIDSYITDGEFYNSFITADHFNTSIGSRYTHPNPGFPPYEYIGSVNTKAGAAMGDETWAELRQTVNGNDYSFIRSTNLGGAYSANILEVGSVGYDWSNIEQNLNRLKISASDPNYTGIEYDQDWSANFVNRSLVDKAYVDNAVTGATGTLNLEQVLTNGNVSGPNNIELSDDGGGYTYGLIAPSNVFSSSFKFEDYGSGSWAPKIQTQYNNNNNYIIVGDSDTSIKNSIYNAGIDQTSGEIKVGQAQILNTVEDTITGDMTQIVVVPNQLYHTVSNSISGESVTNFLSSTTYAITGPTSIFAGAVYSDDYSANFNSRSLVDKGYVDAAVAGSTGGGAATSFKVQVRNQTGATIRKGTIVYIQSSTGNLPTIQKAQANAESTSAGTFGVADTDIANNGDGYVVAMGSITTLDTRSTATYPFTSDTLLDGDKIYLSPTTAGYVTKTKPSAPNHLVYLGTVIRTSPTNGYIEYRIQNGYELEELHNVAITSPANNDVLTYETSTSLWKNKPIPTVSTPTLSTVLTAGNTAGTSINMNNNAVTNVSTVSANAGPTAQMINIINAANMMLLYNS